MKKNLLTLLLSLFIIGFTASCSDDDDNNGNGGGISDVIEEVQAQFAEDHPNAINTEWKITKDNYAVALYNEHFGTKATETVRMFKSWYKNEKTATITEVMKEQAVGYDALPEVVSTAFKASVYADETKWEVDKDDVEKIVRGEMTPVYVIEVDSKTEGVEDVDLYYDETGILIKVIVDKDGSYDKHQGLIISEELPAEVTAYLTENHKEARIVDIDVEEADDDFEQIVTEEVEKYWEVEVIEEVEGVKVKKEIIFDYATKAWIYTTWEVEAELPAAITDVIAKDYVDYEFDEDEFDIVIYGDYDKLYKVELEYEGEEEGKEDLVIYFNEKGEVIFPTPATEE